MIMGGVGEDVHLVLGDRVPLARPDVLADHAEQVSPLLNWVTIALQSG